jgi:hypothetical protein
MNPRKEERRKRFAEMARRQKLREAERAERNSAMHEARVEVSKCAPALGDASRNLHQKHPSNMFTQSGFFTVEHWRGGKKIGEYAMKNGITNQGLNDILDVQFDNGNKKANWYMGLINLSGFTALDATDTYDDIDQAGNGWDTFSSYTDANNMSSSTTRPEWPTDAPSGQSITNSGTKAIYDITAAGTVKGIFIVAGQNAQTKGDHAPGTTPPNILWSTALFSGGDVVVANSDQLKVTYTVNAAAS